MSDSINFFKSYCPFSSINLNDAAVILASVSIDIEKLFWFVIGKVLTASNNDLFTASS